MHPLWKHHIPCAAGVNLAQESSKKLACQQNHTLALLLKCCIQMFNPVKTVQPNPISEPERGFLRSKSLRALPTPWEKTLTWNPAAILALFKNKYPKNHSEELEALSVFLTQCVKRLQCCDITSRWALHTLNAHGCSSLSWVISYIPLLDWVYLNNWLQLQKQTPASLGQIVHCIDFSPRFNDVLWITLQSRMF